jgi:hypothetical protein
MVSDPVRARPAALRFALRFVLQVALRVRRNSRPKKQKQSGGISSSDELHDFR